VARHLCPPATPAATGLLARHATRPGLRQEPPPRRTVPGPGPRRQGAGHHDPAAAPGRRESRRATPLAFVPRSPPGRHHRRSPFGAAIPTRRQASVRSPPQPRVRPRKGNAERDDDDNAVRALTTPTRNPNPGPALQAETPGSSPRPPVIGITCLDCCRFGAPDDPGHQAASRTPGPRRDRRLRDTGRRVPAGRLGSGRRGRLGPALAAKVALTGGPEIADPVGSSVGRYQMTAPADLDGDDGHLAGLASPGGRPG
jgi:hypothetical protein